MVLGTPPSPVAEGIGCEQGSGRNGEASCKGEEGARGGLGAKGTERKPVPPEEKRRGGVYSEGYGEAVPRASSPTQRRPSMAKELKLR